MKGFPVESKPVCYDSAQGDFCVRPKGVRQSKDWNMKENAGLGFWIWGVAEVIAARPLCETSRFPANPDERRRQRPSGSAENKRRLQTAEAWLNLFDLKKIMEQKLKRIFRSKVSSRLTP